MDLTKYGVTEMNESEKKQVEGGFFALAVMGKVVLAHIAIQFAGNPKAHFNAFKEGWEMGGK